jgi:hypothetical protein
MYVGILMNNLRIVQFEKLGLLKFHEVYCNRGVSHFR